MGQNWLTGIKMGQHGSMWVKIGNPEEIKDNPEEIYGKYRGIAG